MAISNGKVIVGTSTAAVVCTTDEQLSVSLYVAGGKVFVGGSGVTAATGLRLPSGVTTLSVFGTLYAIAESEEDSVGYFFSYGVA